jgi:hypothetical protein
MTSHTYNTITVVKSRRVKWERYVARKAETRKDHSIFKGKLQGSDLDLGDLEGITLKFTLKTDCEGVY